MYRFKLEVLDKAIYNHFTGKIEYCRFIKECYIDILQPMYPEYMELIPLENIIEEVPEVINIKEKSKKNDK